MPTQRELDLAKRLLRLRVLDAGPLKEALALQARQHELGREVGLDRVLYHLKLLPPGALGPALGPTPLATQPFPGYRLLGLAGEGGTAVVYRGVYTANGHPVAVKVLDPIHALRPDFVQRFEQEAELLIRLEHENIVLGYEVGAAGGWHYFTMDLVEGATVQEVIERRGPLGKEEALSVTLQAGRALAYLHGQGFLHRDVKPGNLMVEASGRVRLIDLGFIRRLARELAAAQEEEEATTVGTVEYVSPEQARGRADLDPRSDIYSLGISLYHMVVGEVPFQGETDYEVMAKQVLSALDTQKVKQRRISPEVHYFITKMASKDRESRYETVAEALVEMAGYLPGGPVPVDLGVPPGGPPAAPPPPAPPAGLRPPAPQGPRPGSRPLRRPRRRR